MKVILITGASTGIGLATAEQLLSDGNFVILTARKESLGRLSGTEFLRKYPNHWVRPLDVRDSTERQRLMNDIERDLSKLDVLINNAAVIYRAPIECAYDFECREQMLVNFHAPLELIKAAVGLMRKTGGGHIINVSSAAGFLAIPTMGLYAASKHALEAASEALYHELKDQGIKVTLIEPGFISSDSYLKARLSLALDRGNNTNAQSYTSLSNTITCLIDRASRWTHATPEMVAVTIKKVIAMKRPPLRKPVTLDAKVFALLKRFLPGRLYDGLIEYCLKCIHKQLTNANQKPAPNAGQVPLQF